MNVKREDLSIYSVTLFHDKWWFVTPVMHSFDAIVVVVVVILFTIFNHDNNNEI